MIRIFMSICLSLGYHTVFSQEWLQIQPEYPSPGDQVVIKYDFSQAPLGYPSDINLIAYLKHDQSLTAWELPLKRQGTSYVAVLNTNPQTKVVFIKVTDKNDRQLKIPDNQSSYVMMYEKDKEKPVQGACFSLGYSLVYEAEVVGLNRDPAKGMLLMEQEWALYPDSKLDPDYMGRYASVFLRKNNEKARNELRQIAESWSKEKKDERKMTYAYEFFKKLGDEVAAGKLQKKISRRYPHGILVKDKIMSDFWEARGNMEGKERAFAKMERIVNPSDENDIKMLAQMASNLAATFGQAGNWEKFDRYTHISAGGRDLANTLNSLAWGMAGQDLNSAGADLDKAAQLSQRSIKLIEEALSAPLKNKPDHLTKRQHLTDLNVSYGMFLDTYALIQFKQGNYTAALRNQELAIEKNPSSLAGSYERHALLVEKVKGGAAAESLLEYYIQENKQTSAMVAQYRRLFLANNTLESAYEKNLTLLSQKSRLEGYEKLSRKMLNLPAPDFELTNLKGEIVRLSDLAGKVVVLDFWASWCRPCIASFSAMKQIMDKYKDNDQVVFLFINSWENGEDKEKMAVDFLKRYGFSEFNTLMDKENKVIESYKVEGIPVQFVIGPKGTIHFKNIGFNGNDSEHSTKLQMMIELSAK